MADSSFLDWLFFDERHRTLAKRLEDWARAQLAAILGGDGVRKGHVVERLYREIKALCIYEGASDMQKIKIVIARQALQLAESGG